MTSSLTPQQQARILEKALAQKHGWHLKHQQALDLVAQLHGHRNYNVMAAVAHKPANPNSPPAANPPANDLPASEPFTVYGFGVGDVQSLRPDLSEAQAQEVLLAAERDFDASIGLNWDVLQAIADRTVPHWCITGVLYPRVASHAHEWFSVTVDLATGRVYHGIPRWWENTKSPTPVASAVVAGARLVVPNFDELDFAEDELELEYGDSEGLAALTAAIRAQELENQVTILERMRQRTGNC